MDKTIKLTSIRLNPDNPRLIRDGKFKKLVESIKRDPEFLEKRGIVHADGVILGGNQRYLAIKEALKDDAFRGDLPKGEIPASWVQDASDWPEEKRRRFIILDNASFGEMDFDVLANLFSDLPLVDLGVDLPEDWLKEGEEENNMTKIINCKKIEDVSIHHPTINKVRSCRFISVRRFKNNKDQAIDIFKSIKKERDFDVENFIASEVSELLTSFGIFKDMIVTPAPRGHSLKNDYYLSGVVADKIADKLGIISCQLFKDNIKKTNNIHKYEEKNACLLGDIKSKNIIIFDDIATTGTTMENCCKALCKHNFIIPIVYIYETLKTGE
jgi:predicted amidophosphoribosyltransferase